MSAILDEFRIFHSAEQQIKSKVKYFHVFSENLAFLITNNDQVYGFGRDLFFYIGIPLNFDNRIDLITELCNKKIVSFLNASNQVLFARSSDRKIYGSGRNDHGQIGLEIKKALERPKKLRYFDDKNIIEIAIGLNHCLALSHDGRIFGWGDNSCGQFAKIEDFNQQLSKPVQIKLTYLVQSVCCYGNNTIIISKDGAVYILSNGTLNPQLNERVSKGVIKIINVDKIDSVIIWKNDAIIYCIHQNSVISSVRIIEINSDDTFIVPITDCIFDRVRSTIVGIAFGIMHRFDFLNSRIIPNYNKIFDYSLFALQITNYTVYIKDTGIYTRTYDMINDEFSEKVIAIYDDVQDFRKIYDSQLEEMRKMKQMSIYNLIPVNLEKNIEYFHMNGAYSSAHYSAYFVMNDKSVYVYGFNENGLLGLGNDDIVTECILNPHLSGKGLVEFFCGESIVFARNHNNEIYGWGRIFSDLFAIIFELDACEISIPQKISYFDDKSIINICVGEQHFMALSAFGKVYCWGVNIWYKSFLEEEKFIMYTPMEIKLSSDPLERFKYIHCGPISYCAINTEGKVYFWSDSIGIENPYVSSFVVEINQHKIAKFYPESKGHNLFVLTQAGNFHQVDWNEDWKVTLNFTNLHFSDMMIDAGVNSVILQREDGVYILINSELIKMNSCNFFDYFLYYRETLYATLKIRRDCFIETSIIKFNEEYHSDSGEILFKHYQNVFEEKYSKFFEEIDAIGQGSFGEVFKVKHKIDHKLYAIKLSKIDGEFRFN